MKTKQFLITQDSVKSWNLLDGKSGKIIECYKFFTNGKCVRMFYTKDGGLFNWYDDDVIVPHTWELINDSTIAVQGYQRRIIKLEDDTMLLKNTKTGDIYLFIKKQ